MKAERGCNKPGENYGKGSMVFRFTSPMLVEGKSDILEECPVGAILRESPHTYSLINAASYIETGAIGPTDLPLTTRQVHSIVTSERSRMREVKKSFDQGLHDSRRATAAIRGH